MPGEYGNTMRAELAPAANASPYGDLMRAEIDSDRARFGATATQAVGVNPDDVAKARKTATFLGVTPAVVEATPADSARQAQIKRLELDTAQAPTLRGNFLDRDFAKLAHDDSGVLSGIESVVRRIMDGGARKFNRADPAVMTGREYSAAVRRQMELNPALDADTARSLVMQGTTIDNQNPLMGVSRGPAPSVSSIMGGIFNMERFRAQSQGASVAAADLLGLDNSTALTKYRQAKSRAQLADPEFETSTGQGLYGGAVSTVQNAPGIVLSLITGNPAPGLALMGSQVGAEAYGKYRERGATAGEAAVGALAEGGIEVATERLPMGFLVNKLGKAGAGEFIKGLLARELPTEQLATLAQDAVDTAIANPDKTWGDYFAERPDAAYQTLLATLVQSGAMGALNVAAGKVLPERAAAARAEEAATDLQQLGELMAQSKLRERAPDSFNQFMAQIAESGQTPSELYIDAEVLANVLNQSGINLEALRQVAPSVADQLEAQAYVPGADVRVPVAEFAAAGPEIVTPLLNHLREAPDAMSRTEAQEYLAAEGDKIRADVETQLAEREDATAFKAQVQEATSQFEQQLTTVGRFRPEVNKAYASLLGNFYAVQALRAGTTPADLMQRYDLRIVAQTRAGALLDQFVPIGKLGQGEPYTGATMKEITALNDVPTVDVMREAIEAVGAEEFERRAQARIQEVKKGKFQNPPDALLIEATARDIVAVTRRGLRQAEAQITRGSFDPSTNTMALLAGADLSTFIHESGHFFLEVQADLAAKIQTAISSGAEVSPAERSIVDDMGRILTWFGVTADADMSALDRWVTMTLDEKRQHHEQWARGFERYVMEGKAPSQELQALFARFRAWLVSVYKTLAGLNVELSDDVRGVMDRLLASDTAIADQQAARAMGPLFQSPEQAGMTPEEYADYQALAERATAGASAELDARMLRDMKWLSRARDKALKARQAEVDALRKEAEREVRAEVMAEPIYRAWAFLTGKADKIAPGTVAPENMSELASGRLRSSLVKETNPDAFDRLAELRMVSEKNGLDPDIVAELFGFASGQELIETLRTTAKPSAVIEELTDFQMMQRHGDIASPDALNRAADEAVHNELRARVIASELKALAKANTVKEAASSGRNTIDVMAQAARQYALQVIARQQIKNLRPQQYAAAEARSAKLAQKSLGDTAQAALHKRNQLVNNYATKAAYDAQKEVKAGVEFFRKIAASSRDTLQKTRDWDVVQAARAILAEYGVGKKGEAAQSYLKVVAEHDPAMFQVLRDKVDALTVNARPLAELTIEEFRGLHEEMRALWYLAKRSRQMEIDGNLLDIQDVTDPLVERMEQIGIPDRVPGEGQAVTDAERRIARLQTLRAALRRVESWVGVKDGADMGPFRRFIWQPVKEAADAYRADKAKYLKRYRALLAPLDVGRERIAAPELGYVFGFSRGGSGKAEILHALLHTGNASNLRKLLLGRKWATERPDGTLDTTRWDAFVTRMITEGKLGKADFDFAQGVWDLLEDMKPLAQKAHRDVFGRYFDEVTADPFTNQFGAYRGGYVPAMMDAEVVKDAATRALQEDENQTLAYAFPGTNRGFTKARVENNKPLLLDLRSLSTHMDKVLLFSHMEQPIRDVRKVLTSKSVSMPLHRIDPVAFDGLLTPWMNRAARQTVETRVPGDNGLMRFFSKARSRAGMAAMFANITNTAQQITGLSIAAVKVKPRHLVDAAAQWVRAPRQTARAVAEASPYMATRMDNEVAQMADAINDILLNPSVYEQAQAWAAKHAYFMQSAVDNVIGPIVWTGAYNQALEAGHSELDARRLADAAVRQTQGSTLPEDVSRIETGNAFVRMFTQFAGYFNMQANLLGTEFAKTQHELGLRKGMGRGLYVFTLGFLVPAMVSELIVQASRGGPDDEDKDGSTLDDWLLAVLVMGNVRAALGMVPGVGQTANATINTFNSKPYDDRISTAPAVSMIESAVSAPHSVYKAVAEDGNARKAVRDLATLISMTTGLPANAIARPVGYLAGVGQDKIEPTGPVDAARGVVTGTASPESKR
ncbi:MAG TPA: hypothetical protein VLJ58_21435 [Ramlibacter sp.]|nr:hypothetical protein [Ramlibacter sp.]